MIRRRWIPVALIIGVPVLGFVAYEHSRISIPPTPPIDKITVTISGDVTVSTTTDPARIASVIAFLNQNDDFWMYSWGTFPTPRYSVRFESAGQLQYVVWISVPSGNWIGFRNAGGTSKDNVLRLISAAEYANILGRLGIVPAP
jgi:hypothetical protein